jgi:anti-sigma regulatory factor (Ser/Thr protein kinase)
MSEPIYSSRYEVHKDDFAAAGEVSALIKRKLKQIGMDASVIRKIAVAAYEAEVNMIIHSLGGEMSLEIYPEHVLITSADTGPGITDINLAMQEGYSTASEDVRNMGFGAGMGLPNMNKNCDRMDVESSPAGTTIRMKFNI